MNRLKRALLTGLAIIVLGAGVAGACKRDYNVPTTEPTHIASPTATPTDTIPTATPKSTYDLALEKLDSQTAEYWKGVARDLNSEKAIDELVFLPEQGRLALADDIKAYAADRAISDKELSDLADPDKDGVNSSVEARNGTNPMDPSNSTQKISPAAFAFVRGLAEYRNSVSDARALPQIYSGLEGVIYVVERYPKIVNGLNMFGNDALALLIADNLGIIDMDKYWFLTNATALQVQDFVYAGNEIMWEGRFKDQINGPATDKKFDEKEREITNFRLRKQIEWKGKGSTPLEYEEAVREYGSEQRASNALRWRVLPQRLFVEDIAFDRENGEYRGSHPLYSTFDSNTWLVVASYNNEHSEEVRAEILARLNDPDRYARDAERIKELYKGASTLRNVGTINQKVSEYVNIIFSEGKPYEIAPILMYLYAREQMHHDQAMGQSTLWLTLIGASGGVGSAYIIHPSGHETYDGQFLFTLSESTQKKLPGVFVYGIDDLAQLIPGIDRNDAKYLSLDGMFGVPYSNMDALRTDGVKHLKVLTPGFSVIEVPIPK